MALALLLALRRGQQVNPVVSLETGILGFGVRTWTPGDHYGHRGPCPALGENFAMESQRFPSFIRANYMSHNVHSPQRIAMGCYNRILFCSYIYKTSQQPMSQSVPKGSFSFWWVLITGQKSGLTYTVLFGDSCNKSRLNRGFCFAIYAMELIILVDKLPLNFYFAWCFHTGSASTWWASIPPTFWQLRIIPEHFSSLHTTYLR